MPLETVACPVCGTEQPALSRYPGYLCRDCVARASTADGRRLALVNTSESGGFAARYADSGELCEEVTVTHEVYVDGVSCHADEGRVGGIVVQAWPDQDRPDQDRPDQDRPDQDGPPLSR